MSAFTKTLRACIEYREMVDKLKTENAALRADIHAHGQINKQLIEDKRRLDYMEQNVDFVSWRFYGKPQSWDLRGAIDAKRKETP